MSLTPVLVTVRDSATGATGGIRRTIAVVTRDTSNELTRGLSPGAMPVECILAIASPPV
jgi:hypothetical protein